MSRTVVDECLCTYEVLFLCLDCCLSSHSNFLAIYALFQVLGVEKNASQREIQKAFHKYVFHWGLFILFSAQSNYDFCLLSDSLPLLPKITLPDHVDHIPKRAMIYLQFFY